MAMPDVLKLAAGVAAVAMTGYGLHRLLRASVTSLSGAAAGPMPGAQTRHLSNQDREFLPAALEIIETPPAPLRVATLWFICVAFLGALAWAWLGSIDIHAVAQGRIQPSGRSKVIQPVEPGKVVAIKVQNGTTVAAGDLLLELDPTETGADREALARDLETARGEAARRSTAIAIARSGVLAPRPATYPESVSATVRERENEALTFEIEQLAATIVGLKAQHAANVATIAKLKASLKARERVIALAKERVDMRDKLSKNGSLSRAMVIEVETQYEQLLTTQAGEQGQVAEAEAQIETINSKMTETRSQFIADQRVKMLEAERKADHTSQELVKAKVKNERTSLTAPIAGTVQQLAVSTVGQVVASGQSLMVIVPKDSTIEIEAFVQNQDIGFVEAGQPVVVKIEAFPFTRYGTLDGRIERVSRDAVDEREAMGLADPLVAAKQSGATQGAVQSKMQGLVFPATVRLDRTAIVIDGKDIPLTPGMAVTVEILTGRRRAIDYVLSPLREVASTSAHER